MTVLSFIISALWSVRIVLNILAYVRLWYLKEYRWDRMYIHLRSPEGRSIFFPALRYPPITPKTVVLCLMAFLAIGFLFLTLPVPGLLRLLVIDCLSFPLLSLFVLVLRFPTALYHAILIRIAVAKLRSHKPMTVIGITGSYGKTSTKEMLATVLSDKYRVLKTAASKNSPIAIAELVLRKLRDDHEVFIVEMGAYTRGEIAQMCQMVRPQIGIVTAINAQHQDLFGSIQNTMDAKFELIDGLIGNRIAIMNLDNAYVVKMADKAGAMGVRVIGYSASKPPAPNSEYIGSMPTQEKNKLTFTIKHEDAKVRVQVGLLGLHHVSNILAVFAAAHVSGMDVREIAEACAKITPTTRTMLPLAGVNNSQFIDDTFNNNPDAARAAIEYLALQKGRKILVFQPMIELGAYAQQSHEDVAKLAAGTISEIILTNDSYQTAFEKYKEKLTISVLTPAAAARHIKKTVGPGDTVLFKGKQAAAVLQLLV